MSDGLDRSRRLIAAAAEGYDLIELDGERDIDAGPPRRDPPGEALDLLERSGAVRRRS